MKGIRLVIFIGILGCNTKNSVEQSKNESPQQIGSRKDINRKNENYDYEPIKPLDYARVEQEIQDTSKYYLLKGECAIREWPDTIWLKQYQESMPENSWIEIISDHQYYESLAEDTLALKGIEVFYQLTWKKRYLKFQKFDSTYYILDKNEMKDSWGIILFNGQDNPVIWSDSFISSSIKKIYNK